MMLLITLIFGCTHEAAPALHETGVTEPARE